MKKKIVAMLLGLSMVLGLFAGCGEKEVSKSSESSSSSSQSGVEQSNEASSVVEEEKEKELVSLRFVMYGNTTPRSEEFFKNEFHDKVLEELNIDLTVEVIPNGSKDVLQSMLASGEEFALRYQPLHADWIQRGYLAEIPMELIQENCPNYLAMREEKGFESAKYEDKIYILPMGNKANSGRSQFFTVREDIVKELGYKCEDITTFDELMELFESVKTAYPNMRVMMNSNVIMSILGYEFTGDVLEVVNSVILLKHLEDSDKVYSWFESEEFETFSKLNAEFLEKGYVIGDNFTDSKKATADWNAGNCFARAGVAGEIIETGFKATIPEAEIGRIQIGDAPYTMNRDYDWGVSIATSDKDNLERWLELFDWMYKDQETYDFCIYGVEGKDYKVNEDGSIEKLGTDVFWPDWYLMAKCYNRYSPDLTEEKIALYESTDDNAIIAKHTGFSFDTTPVSTEQSLINAVVTEYLNPILLGYVDYDENIDNALAKLKAAGIDAYVAEYQKQFSEWYKENKK